MVRKWGVRLCLWTKDLDIKQHDAPVSTSTLAGVSSKDAEYTMLVVPMECRKWWVPAFVGEYSLFRLKWLAEMLKLCDFMVGR